MEKNLASAITHIYPNLVPFVDFRVVSENGDQKIVEWNTTEAKPTQYQLDTAWNNYVDGINSIDVLKQKKIDELDNACKNAILANFTATLNGIEYGFSYDNEAQNRFNGVGLLFLGGQITSIPWTAYQNGERVRITLTKDDFNVISLAALKHQNDNVSKYSDLFIKVNNATMAYEVTQITWETN
jgi:hypothetical protein